MEIKNLIIKYNDNVLYKDFSLTIKENEITCIMGPSGCGKTTLLNAIADNLKYEGEILGKKESAYVFQTPRLINQISVRNNLEFVLDKKDYCKIEDTLSLLKIKDLIDKYPDEISGGEASRVSLARALLYERENLLLDEPFKDLDYALKHQLLVLFKNIIKEKKLSCVYVTHDIDEALFMADRIIVLHNKPVEIKLDLEIKNKGDDLFMTSKAADGYRHDLYNALIK